MSSFFLSLAAQSANRFFGASDSITIAEWTPDGHRLVEPTSDDSFPLEPPEDRPDTTS